MEILVLLLLFWLGISFGSFVNALVWRIHQQRIKKGKANRKLSITRGRSMCSHCRHELAAVDLIPIFSWIWLKGKCRYCNKPISTHDSPLVELILGIVFVTSYVFWPGGVNEAGDRLLLITWLVGSVGLLALAVYDLKWMLLPSRILYPTAVVVASGRLVYIIFYSSDKGSDLLQWLLSIAVASGLFYLLYTVSSGRWIGFGDVRLGLITGTLLSSPTKSGLMIILASYLGTLFILPSIILRKKSLASSLPFGPFLIASTMIMLFYGDPIINWFRDKLLL